MKKALAQYLVPICILLLGGFMNHVYADAQDTSESACIIDYKHIDNSTVAIPLNGAEKNLFVEITDVEEQEERDENGASYNVDIRLGSYLTAFFNGSLSEQTFGQLETNPRHLEPNFTTATQKRHIRFQVFRI